MNQALAAVGHQTVYHRCFSATETEWHSVPLCSCDSCGDHDHRGARGNSGTASACVRDIYMHDLVQCATILRALGGTTNYTQCKCLPLQHDMLAAECPS